MTEANTTPPADPDPVRWYRLWVPGWRVITAVTLLMLALPLGIRWSRLWWMPNLPEPFDVEAFSELPVMNDNAYVYFRKALFQHVRIPMDREFCDLQERLNGNVSWDQTPESIRAWVMSNQEALGLFRQGGRCADANFLPPEDYTINTLLGVQQDLRDMFWVANLDAFRLLDEGNPREAAELLHDSFRASRHLGRRGCLIERFIGIACHAHILPAWRAWCRHPQVTAEDLEAALVRMREDWKLTPPVSDPLKVEYLMVLNETKMPMTNLRSEFNDFIEDTAVKRLGMSVQGVLGPLKRSVPYWQVPVLWTIGEPELSARAVRLYTTHELKTCDLPFEEQPERIDGPFSLCRDSEGTGGLTAEAICDRIQATFAAQLLGGLGQVCRAVRNEASRQALLETELQFQIHYRRNPATSRADAERLAAAFDWPIDASSVEGKPLQFRFEEAGLVIWSVGRDRIDQGGVVDPDINQAHDEVVVIPWPGEEGARGGAE